MKRRSMDFSSYDSKDGIAVPWSKNPWLMVRRRANVEMAAVNRNAELNGPFDYDRAAPFDALLDLARETREWRTRNNELALEVWEDEGGATECRTLIA